MSTRAIVRVFEAGDEILTLYQHSDGHPEGLGRRLSRFLALRRLVNGLPPGEQSVANGMGCLAAQLVAALKSERKGPGDLYVVKPGASDLWEQYEYRIWGPPSSAIQWDVPRFAELSIWRVTRNEAGARELVECAS